MKLEAVILTKSRMYSNSCVTAYDPAEKRFVRFVSDMRGSPIDKGISDEFHLLDLVSVSVLRPCPISPQTENLLVNQYSFSVIKRRELGIRRIYRMIQPPPLSQSFVYQTNGDELPDNRLRSVSSYKHSLELIPVSKLRVFVNDYDAVKADFQCLSGMRYAFSVTDPEFENAVRESKTKELRFKHAYIMVSISLKPYERDGFYYKFIAAIYPIHEIPF